MRPLAFKMGIWSEFIIAKPVNFLHTFPKRCDKLKNCYFNKFISKKGLIVSIVSIKIQFSGIK